MRLRPPRLLWQTNIAVGEATSAFSAEYRIHRVLSLDHLRTPQLLGTFRLESINQADTVRAAHAANLGRLTFRILFAYARRMDRDSVFADILGALTLGIPKLHTEVNLDALIKLCH
jgi:hypothetical protein